MNVFIPISLLTFALLYTVAQGCAVVALGSILERQKKFTVNMNVVVAIDAVLCIAAAVCGLFL